MTDDMHNPAIKLFLLTQRAADDAELYHGAPVGLQLVGRRLQEEKVLALTELVADGLARIKQ